ncbi:sterol carrier family protein [Allostreptomyces psammosilenae]|uniref:Uncharacterized protein (TIGR03083 family) n=1 Tax=Allostreptomyces psammosilenae TaxID=1892865 RepID=A0A853A3A4_9ACTN|nr:sterol carrier family protein [Allostreptomyces psammosilenae]NYI05191.1 uncharacterized protein (TIGR03083 family) [Allostreptomyces psammosilenae]
MPSRPPRPSRPRLRRFDPARSARALLAEADAWVEVVRRLADHHRAAELLDAPSGLTGWRIRDLLAHVVMGMEEVPARLAEPRPERAEMDLLGWIGATAGAAATVDELARADAETAAATPPGALVERFRAARQRLAEAVAAEPAERPVPTRYAPMSLGDRVVTRIVELVVHGDDLQRALAAHSERQSEGEGREAPHGAPPPQAVAALPAALPAEFPHDRQALATVVRLFADALAASAPGGAVEVRVPPFAVVQCVEGPRHTRGTPPNVVETDPLTWLRLATGRTRWVEAVGAAAVTASGERSDLAPHLPLMG